MNEETKIQNRKRLIRYAVTAGADLVLALVLSYARYKSFDESIKGTPLFQGLSDGFIVVGFFNFAFGVLLWIASTGTLDIITYAIKAAVWFIIPIKRSTGLGDYYEYKVKQKEKRKGIPFETIWIGLAFIAISALFAYLA
ncbi:MAG: DUF3899 domain-containing protein [Eubacteriales bacterium]